MDLLRQGVPEKGKKPLLAALGMLGEASLEIQTNAVKMGVLAPIGDILTDDKQNLQVFRREGEMEEENRDQKRKIVTLFLEDLCLDLIWTYASNHDMNKMQISFFLFLLLYK